jgi:hypothetical protein
MVSEPNETAEEFAGGEVICHHSPASRTDQSV